MWPYSIVDCEIIDSISQSINKVLAIKNATMSVKSIFSNSTMLLGLVLFGLASCSNSDEDTVAFFIEAELQVYFDRFEVEAAQRGLIIDLQSAQVSGEISEIADPGVAGQCTSNSDEPNLVTIDKSTWNSLRDLEKEYLVFHELGHCYLNRGHFDEVQANGTCESMMQSGTINCRKNYNSLTRAAYLDELFGY